MFYRNFADEEDNPVNNTNIYNVEGDNPTFAMGIISFCKTSKISYYFYRVKNYVEYNDID
jgi:hypothetical protein